MAKKTVRVLVTGRVQGVFFRSFTEQEARKLGLVGWVINRPEGTVEAVVEGDAAKVDLMLDWFRNHGSPMSLVCKVQVREEEPGNYSSFEILY